MAKKVEIEEKEGARLPLAPERERSSATPSSGGHPHNAPVESTIEVPYELPEGWKDKHNYSFDELAQLIGTVHHDSYDSAVKAVNRIATVRNYVIGFYIVEYEQNGSDRAVYGARLIKKLAEKINKRGLNETLLKNCRRFYMLYPQVNAFLIGKSPMPSDFSTIENSTIPSHQFETSAEQIITKLSFSHIVEIMTVDDKLARFFYETECMKCCWSVKELRRQISTNLYFRAGISKNPEKLLVPQINTTSTFSIKDPFTFEFLGLKPEAFSESDLEDALILHLQEFLLELGKGFCFEARQKRMIIDDEYYFADLVFYNRILHCNVIIELKDDEFRHADLSQLNAYVSYFKENEMHDGDNPPVGILLCTRKGKKMVEYALAGLDNKLFISTYMLALPDTKTLEDFLKKETMKMEHTENKI